jgi:hypothetical protein
LLSQQGKGQNFIDELDIALTQLNGVIDKAKSRNGCVLQGQNVHLFAENHSNLFQLHYEHLHFEELL